MRLSLRGHGSAPAKSWDELALHKASVPGFSTPPSVRPRVMAWPFNLNRVHARRPLSSQSWLGSELVGVNSISLLYFQESMQAVTCQSPKAWGECACCPSTEISPCDAGGARGGC